MTRSRSFSRSSARLGSVAQLERADEHADDVRAARGTPR